MIAIPIILLGVFGFVFSLTITFHRWLFGGSVSIRERAQALVGESTVSIRQQELSFPLYQRFVKPLLMEFARTVMRYLPASGGEVLEQRLVEAGRPWNMSPRAILAAKYVLSAGGALAFLQFWRLIAQGMLQSVLMAAFGCCVGWLLPDVIINTRIRQRKEEVEKILPDVLDLITVCVEAGLGFDAALVKVVEKSQGVLAAEFAIALQEIRMGKPRREALRELADRIQVDDLSNFVGSIIMAEQLGISIGNVLRSQSQDARQRRRQRVEEAAMKAPVKMLLPLVLFIFPAVFIVLLGPAAIQIMRAFSF
ncbi:MAG: type II secretion system F family protein [Firmicutes bacterium]|nr:type II secretion system F family protein [Bacillota bacterium]